MLWPPNVDAFGVFLPKAHLPRPSGANLGEIAGAGFARWKIRDCGEARTLALFVDLLDDCCVSFVDDTALYF